MPAVKADAANSLFKVNCKNIVWAVLDSGIDRDHEAFMVEQGKSRIRKTFDFTRIREIVNRDNANSADEELKFPLLERIRSRTPANRPEERARAVEDDCRRRESNSGRPTGTWSKS